MNVVQISGGAATDQRNELSGDYFVNIDDMDAICLKIPDWARRYARSSK